MYFYFLAEDLSSKFLIDELMIKFKHAYSDVYYDCKAFRGIGGFTKKNTVKETKTGKLLNDLTTYLRGFNKKLTGIDATIVVMLDNDERCTDAFRKELEEIIINNNITVDHILAIAVEEMEAWLLGDINALYEAYPNAKKNIVLSYKQDSICGTWETLANAIYPGGLVKMKKECPTYIEKGKIKAEWAARIGKHMNIYNNASPSFQHFISEMTNRLDNVFLKA